MGVISSIVGAIGGLVGTIGSFIGSLGFVGRAAISIGMNMAVDALSKKRNKRGQKTDQAGTQLSYTAGGSQPRTIGVGLFATAGQDISPPLAFGEANKTAVKIFKLSDFRIDGVNRVAINGVWNWLSGDNNAADGRGFNVVGDSFGFIRIKFYYGRLDQPADWHLKYWSDGMWTDTHRGAGVAYAIVYVDYDKDKFQSFPQSFIFECRGVCYDPRFDSTMGGSGPQRWNDNTTWGYSENPIVQAYNYERGFFLNDELVIGKGMPISDLPLSPWVAAMNACDESVNGKARYRSGFIFNAADGTQHRSNLEPVLAACAGSLVERVDGDVPLVGITQPVVATLTDDDFISSVERAYQAKRTRSDLVNAIHGSYNEPSSLWEATPFPAQSSQTALDADGERHAVKIDYTAVFDGGQATRLALAALNGARYQATVSGVFRPRWGKLEIGDWINLILKNHSQRTYRVINKLLMPLGPNGARNVSMSLQEVGAGIYDVNVTIPEQPPIIAPTEPTYQNFPDNFKVAAVHVEKDKRKLPGLQIEWRAPTDVTVDGIIIEYWQTSVPDEKYRIQREVRLPKTSDLITGLLPRESYTVRATVIPNPPRNTLWGQEIVVTTLDEDFEIDAEGIISDIAAYDKWINYDQRALREREELLSLIETDAEAAGYEQSRTIKRQVSVAVGNARAEFRETITVAVSEIRAMASKLEVLEVEVNENIATAVNDLRVEINEIDGKVEATTSLVTDLSAQVGEISSSVSIKAEAQASPGGGWARYGIKVKTEDGEGYSVGAFYIDTQPGQSRILMQADQWIVTDGDQSQQPLTFQNGLLRLQAADIGDVIAGYIHSADNRFIIDVNNRRIVISD